MRYDHVVVTTKRRVNVALSIVLTAGFICGYALGSGVVGW